MDLSIIFVNWNSLNYLRECVPSIYQHTTDLTFEIIVVDNASPEGHIEELQQEFPGIRVIKSDINLGFAGANNLGFRHATGTNVLFLNPDTRLTGPSIRIMLDQLTSLPDAGIVGCKLLNKDLSIQLSSIQTFPTILNQLLDIEVLQVKWPKCYLWNIAPLFSNDPKPTVVEVISGACMLMSSKVFKQAGMFSEEYFMYAEDLDLCYKVTRLGLRNYYVGQTEIIHYGGASSSQTKINQWSTTMKLKAVQKFCTKTHGPFYGAMYRVMMGGAALGRLMTLTLLRPVGSNDSRKLAIRRASSKWNAVLKWSCGFDKAQS
jgi:GT2 family glycosyltransferase